MPKQVSATDKIIFPDGVAFEVSLDSGSTYFNLGVLGGGTTLTYNYDKIEVESGNAGKLSARVKNQTIALAPSPLLDWDPEIWDKFDGGLFTYSSIAGSTVSGATQTVASGSWGWNDPIVIANQNGDGTAVTINSVTLGY